MLTHEYEYQYSLNIEFQDTGTHENKEVWELEYSW